MVDESFEIRDLVFSSKQARRFLILILSGNEFSVYLSDSKIPMRILSDETMSASGEAPAKGGDFTDVAGQKEIIMEKFLHQIDNSLDTVLNVYRLPLFVLGTKRIAGHFKALSRHNKEVVDYIHGNYENMSAAELQKILDPFIADWVKIEQIDILNKLEVAANKRKLVYGIRDVWQEANDHKGQLLVVEKNYMHSSKDVTDQEIIDRNDPPGQLVYIKDAVDDIIERVLENGGEVEFTDEDILQKFQKIALIKYY